MREIIRIRLKSLVSGIRITSILVNLFTRKGMNFSYIFRFILASFSSMQYRGYFKMVMGHRHWFCILNAYKIASQILLKVILRDSKQLCVVLADGVRNVHVQMLARILFGRKDQTLGILYC